MLLFVIFALISTFLVLRSLMRKISIGNFGDRYVFITGCDSGFGNWLAKRLDDMGFRVFAGCLSNSGLDAIRRTCSGNVTAVEIDVSKEASIEKCLEEVKRMLPPNKGLWAVVNNAGRVGGAGVTAWQTRKDYEDTMAVNLYGTIFVTMAFLPLVQLEKGRIVNMSSIIGRFPFLNAPYAISKIGVEAFSDIIRREVYHTGVSVHIIEPGFFRTPLLDFDTNIGKLRAKIESLPSKVLNDLPQDTFNKMQEGYKRILSRSSTDTYKVVDAYVHAITSKFPKARYMVGTDANVKFRILMHLPEWIGDYLMRRGL